MARRIGKTVDERAAQLTLEPKFVESDAVDAEEQNRVLKLMCDAVQAAVQTGGEKIGEARQFRLAVMLKQIYFCGGKGSDGSRIRILPKKEPDGKSLIEKMGSVAVGERMTKLDLQLVEAWGFLEVKRRSRGVARLLKMRWIEALVADVQQAAWEAKHCASGPRAIARGGENIARREGDYCTRNSQTLRVEIKSASNSNSNSGDFRTWGEIVQLIGSEEEALAILETMRGTFSGDYIMSKRRPGDDFGDVHFDRFLEAADALSAADTTTEGVR